MNTVTKGDNYNVPCPHCGRLLHYVCKGEAAEFKKTMKVFSKPCDHCKKVVHFEGNWELIVRAGTERIQ